MTVLYIICCGSPVARDVGRLVALAQERSYDVCVVPTPDGRKFVDVPTLAEQTGHPVRSFYKQPGDPDVLPAADAFIVAPATINTVNKWAAGITDTLALGLINEAYGMGKPVVAMPYTNHLQARHPVFQENLGKLRSWGVKVLYGDDVIKLHPPGEGEGLRHLFPWHLGLDALETDDPAA
ncbi:flavoprotein [Rhizocola hellebori]|uniref:Flavoprotein n=1 Tax=Rhizocola hellebori TaxID=1392758 RepID=A0A8J3Q773_9ACTN|nr:flavoprotein [Rhizocola hellebori]GIH04551.1 flavoprotein [Rhizocola hellebori]